MSFSLTFILVVTAMLAAGWLGRWYLAAERHRLESLAHFSGRYFVATREFLGGSYKDEIPKSVLRHLAVWNEMIAMKGAAGLLVSVLIDLKKEMSEGELHNVRASDDVRVFFQKNPDATECYHKIVSFAIMTVAHSDLLHGLIIRSIMADILADGQDRKLDRCYSAVQVGISSKVKASDLGHSGAIARAA